MINQHFDGVRNLVRCLHWECLECFLQIGSSDEYGNAASPQSESVGNRPYHHTPLAKLQHLTSSKCYTLQKHSPPLFVGYFWCMARPET